MPNFDLKRVKVAKYVNTSGVVSYEAAASVGDAIEANIELKFAEGRLYAESTLAELLKLAIGGTLSLGSKYIPAATQKVMYGCEDSTRTVSGATVTGLKFSGKLAAPGYVGVSFYAPDMIDGALKYTCAHVRKAMFSPPAMKYKTLEGGTIAFNTPSTTGEFLPDDSADKDLLEVAVLDTEADAIAWCDLVLGIPQCATPTATPGAGAVASGTQIALASATAGATIYYTLNGATPTEASAVYNASAKPTIAAATTVKAIAVKAGCANSGVLAAAYTLT